MDFETREKFNEINKKLDRIIAGLDLEEPEPEPAPAESEADE